MIPNRSIGIRVIFEGGAEYSSLNAEVARRAKLSQAARLKDRRGDEVRQPGRRKRALFHDPRPRDLAKQPVLFKVPGSCPPKEVYRFLIPAGMVVMRVAIARRRRL